MTQSTTRACGAPARRRSSRLFGLTLVLVTLALALPGTASAFISTGDGGWFWQNPLPQGNSLSGVAFSDATHGWAVGGSIDSRTATSTAVILATTDGGATWKQQSTKSDAYLSAVAFSDSTHGWAVGYGGAILATIDGGTTWKKQKPGLAASVSLYGVASSDAEHGWAVGYGTIIATTDGGATWKEQRSRIGACRGKHSANP